MSANIDEEKVKQVKEVDLTAAGRGVWLVKVPKYLSEKWKKNSGKCDVGRLKITRLKGVQGAKPEVTFSTNDDQAKQLVPGMPSTTPKEHKFLLTGVGNQNLVVFSEKKKRVAIEGKVIQRAECRPVADKSYLQLKKCALEPLQRELCNKPKREIKQITTVPNSYKPVSNHAANIEHEKKMKEGGKRIRDDKEVVKNRLFEIFEKHQYYNIQDLVKLTNQPV
ncbi:T2FB-like protein, partial [Mya arenaria]